jgi:hypothetical protein
MGDNGEPETGKVWLWISIAVVLAILATLIALYRDSVRHKPASTKSEAAESSIYLPEDL